MKYFFNRLFGSNNREEIKKSKQILELEEKIRTELIQMKLEEITAMTLPGYSIDEDENVTGLSLFYLDIQDYSFLKELKNLTTLDLKYNNISDISFLKELNSLTTLDLSYNQISDISLLKELKNLTTLDLTKNQISKLDPAFMDLQLEVFYEEYAGGLNLYGNPLETPPVEIVKKGKDAVKAYFKSIEGEKQPLNEVKVLLVGDGGSGKTSLVKQLLGDKFDKHEPQTQGINIKQWEIKDGNSRIKVHMWDFGGQEIMHATHQFFLSKRSLYILVLDGRKEEEPEYWLKYIETFGGNSPILVAINKIDDNPRFDLNRPFLQKKYNGITGFYRISCANGTGIQDLKDNLMKELLNVELVRSPFAKTWFNVKNRLENMRENFLSYDEYIDICKNETIHEKISQDTLIEFLNDLGLILHFKEFELEDTYVLEPRWITNAVYKIINSEKLSNNNGVFGLNLLNDVLIKKSETDFYYPRDKYRYIIDLMKKFELCYVIDNDTILIPDLLEIKEPTFAFPENGSLRFIFEYDYLPRSVVPRFIVRMHKDIKDELRWRTGVVLEDKKVYNSSALIKADERDKKIFIYVNGEKRREYFSSIRKTIWDINSSFQRTEIKELVPLPDNVNYTVSYAELVGLEGMGEREITIGELGKKYFVKKLLDGIEDEIERRKNKDSDKRGDTYYNYYIEKEEKIMGDKYNIGGQAGAVGPGAHAEHMTFNQIWNENKANIDLPALAAQLSTLCLKLKDEASEPEHFISMGAVASAETCAKKGDGEGALSHLAKAGKWALGIAEKISVPVATEALKVAVSGYLGIPKV